MSATDMGQLSNIAVSYMLAIKARVGCSTWNGTGKTRWESVSKSPYLMIAMQPHQKSVGKC